MPGSLHGGSFIRILNDSLALGTGLQVTFRRFGGVQSSELKALQQLALVIEQQGLER
jgi:hypothetical protein